MRENELLGAFIDCARREVKNVTLRLVPDRHGGYFCVGRSHGHTVDVALIGEVKDFTKAEKYYSLAQEKALRLGRHPKHISSAESRHPLNDEYAGAIRVDDMWIFSFSGLPERMDEVAMIRTARAASKQGLLYFDPAWEKRICAVMNTGPLVDVLDKRK